MISWDSALVNMIPPRELSARQILSRITQRVAMSPPMPPRSSGSMTPRNPTS
jgi:hypothetical protein